MELLNPVPFPTQIRLENTNACNAVCTMCPRELLSRRKGFVDSALVTRIVQECKGRGVTKFTVQGFGEPILDKNFAKHVRMAKQELGCSTFTVSNANRITPEIAGELVTCGLDKIKVSFYGTNKEEYERVHAPLKYEDTLRGIHNLIEAKKAANSPIVIHLQYIGPLWKLVPFLFRWFGKVRVGYNTLHNYGGGRSYNETEGRKPKGCPMVRDPILQALWNGMVVPCCYDFDGTIPLGDLTTQSIEEVWLGEAYRKFREAHWRNDFSDYPICETCDKRF